MALSAGYATGKNDCLLSLNRRLIAYGPPEEVYTAAILSRTYNASLNVVVHNGMTLVAESPHLYHEFRRPVGISSHSHDDDPVAGEAVVGKGE